MEVRKIPAEESAAWDNLVGASLQGNIFLTYEFQSAWCETDSSLHLLRLGCYDKNGRLVGGQSVFHKKVFGLRIPFPLSIFYASTPILSKEIQEDHEAQHEVLSALARHSRKYFPFLKIEFHPSLKDVRPYLAEGWRAHPEYTYIWDISNPEAILANMNRKRKYARKAQEEYLLAHESGKEIIDDFMELYRETMRKFGWRPEDSWATTLRGRIEWMQARDMVRLYTFRMKSGELVGIVVCILSRINRTAYFILISYNHSINCKEFHPGIHWYAARDLLPEFSLADFGEGSIPSIYSTKDSLGAKSTPYWKLETSNARSWTIYYDILRKGKRVITSHLP
ncbi:MAG: hypothetical protein HY865_21980 [Chloroflexi bacterium]|nr:hypothetical protein [Chloroflexota bacterium]